VLAFSDAVRQYGPKTNRPIKKFVDPLSAQAVCVFI
jgi:hypothetical protein